MKNLQKLGGVAALFHAAAYLIGIVMYFAVLSPIISWTWGVASARRQHLPSVRDHETRRLRGGTCD
jgi:hypothetical protein